MHYVIIISSSEWWKHPYGNGIDQVGKLWIGAIFMLWKYYMINVEKNQFLGKILYT